MADHWIERLHPRDKQGKFATLPGHAVMNDLISGGPDHASIGVTPYKGSRGKSLTSVHDPYLDQYRNSPRFKQFDNDLHREANKLNVRITKQQDAEGIWEGDLEPSTAVEVDGTEANIRELSKRIGRKYNQDAVMVVMDDPTGPDSVHTVDGIEPDKALKAMKKHGLPGGRIIGTDQLEIADPGNESRAAVGALANELGGVLTSRPARVDFV